MAQQQSSWRSSPGPLATGFELLLLDLDGVVYVGRDAVPGAAESLTRAIREGVRCSFVTNNASRPPGVVAEHLRDLGVPAADGTVVTSAQEGAERLAARLAAGARVLAVGGPGVAAALGEVGLEPVDAFAVGVSGVLQGYGPDVSWRDLAEAAYAVAGGAAWVATNPDLTIPTDRGIAPGNGQLTAVVQRTTGREPEVTGKPGRGLFDLAVRRAGGGHALAVGDRLDTDIAGAHAASLESLLVLSGVTGAAGLLEAGPGERPTYLARDLGGLWESHPHVESVAGWWVCRSARARIHEGALDLAGGGPPDTDSSLDGLRAAAAAVWAASDDGAEVDRPRAHEVVARAGG